ncbi:methyl-accepting chemotaxis protein [Rhodobacter maris]|uniref:Methyl-accepting chemotaxis protein n=1 Tax=Rhodobacter maris TaxID=446682 RepID=A0A285S644_9RHOB|nr:methyl-accepting chemotaxis protein [Rhodobacter maris]SOC02848.1 methyl-accepting chemotaxis protein [Rhodobacter maris]
MTSVNLPKTSLRRVMAVSLGLPATLALVFGIFLIAERWQVLSDARMVQQLMELAQDAGAVAHEQQLERGMTSLFLNGTETTLPERLVAQRTATDTARATLLAKADGIGLDHLSDEISALVTELAGDFERSEEIRSGVDARSLPVAEAIEYYTEMDADVLQMVEVVARSTSNARISNRIAAYGAFLTAKERSGLERALGAGAFRKGAFGTQVLLAMRTMVAQQEQALLFFEALAAPQDRAAVARLETLPANVELARMRQIAFTSPETQDLGGVTGEEFFATATQRIEAMKEAESVIGNGIKAEAADEARSALIGFLAVGGIIVGALVGSLILGLRSVRRTETDVRDLAQAAGEMARGALDTALPLPHLRETAQMGAALDSFRVSILEAQERERQARAEREAHRRQEAEREAAARAGKEARLAREAEAARLMAERDRHIAAEISVVVNACAQGDFSRRIDLADKEGILAEICRGLNQIGEIADAGIAEVNRALRHLAEGDLTYLISDGFVGVFAEMAQSVRAANDSITTTVRAIEDTSRIIDSSSAEIGTAAHDLARRSEHNAAMLEETASALEEMASSIGGMAGIANDAKERMHTISTHAESGNTIAQDALVAMESIRQSSERIERVLQVIDEIAFQTNLLALNAGVEAARAGESGRGFAVVASEVRALAQRSSEASREIAQIIETAARDVGRGVEMVDHTADALGQIVGSIGDVQERIEHIAGAVGESKVGIAEISKATTELDRVSQQNAAMIEETNAALSALRIEADQLVANVKRFRTAETDPRATAA